MERYLNFFEKRYNDQRKQNLTHPNLQFRLSAPSPVLVILIFTG